MKNLKKTLVGLAVLLLFLSSVPVALFVSANNGYMPFGYKSVKAQEPCDPNTDPNCPGPPSPTDEPEETCENQSFTALEWIMCPVFKIGAALADRLLEEFEDQLCFRTEASTNPTVDCEATNIDSVKPVWAAMKNIASGLLVVVMLIMIIAQATGRGPFA